METTAEIASRNVADGSVVPIGRTPDAGKVRLHLDVDNRTRAAKRLRTLTGDLAAELTAARNRPPSAAEMLLIEQAAALTLQRLALEADAANGVSIDTRTLISLAGAINRSLRQLGLAAIDAHGGRLDRNNRRAATPQGPSLRELLAAEAAAADTRENEVSPAADVETQAVVAADDHSGGVVS